MLVSLECFLNSPYLKLVEEKGLSGKTFLSMGKKESSYLYPEIGLLSYFSQLWIDRNFALDYMLKSLIKISKKEHRLYFYELRSFIKDYAYNLLGKMLFIITRNIGLITNSLSEDETIELQKLQTKWDRRCNLLDNNRDVLMNLLDHQFVKLLNKFSIFFQDIKEEMLTDHRIMVERIIEEWQSKTEWQLINKN